MIFCKRRQQYCDTPCYNHKDKTKYAHAVVKKVISNRLKIMPDFSSSGIWDGNTGVMVDYKYLAIDDALIHEFEKWIKYYENSFENNSFTLKKGRAEKFNKKGRELAKKLKDKKNMGTGKWKIIYQGEDEIGILKPEIIN